MTTEKENVMSSGPKRVEIVHAPMPQHVERVYYTSTDYIERQQIGWALVARFDEAGRLFTYSAPIFDGFFRESQLFDEGIEVRVHLGADGTVKQWEGDFDPEIGECLQGGTDEASLVAYIASIFKARPKSGPPSWVRDIRKKLDS